MTFIGTTRDNRKDNNRGREQRITIKAKKVIATTTAITIASI